MANRDTLNELLKQGLGESEGVALMAALEDYAAPLPTTVAAFDEVVATSAITGSDTVDAADVLAAIQALETAVTAILTAMETAGFITVTPAE